MQYHCNVTPALHYVTIPPEKIVTDHKLMAVCCDMIAVVGWTLTTSHRYNFAVLVLHWNLFFSCYFQLLLHYIAEGNSSLSKTFAEQNVWRVSRIYFVINHTTQVKQVVFCLQRLLYSKHMFLMFGWEGKVTTFFYKFQVDDDDINSHRIQDEASSQIVFLYDIRDT